MVGAAVGLIVLVLAGCSGGGRAASTTETSAPSVTTRPAGGSTTTTAESEAVDLSVTDQIRSQLVAAGAASNDLPASEYTGLAPGLTYYALDKASDAYWAAARLVPAPSSDPSNPTRAQVASQDAGSYYVFSKPPGGSWTASAAGNTGPSTPCPVTVPSPVVAIWGWPAGSCRPAGT